MKTNRWIWEKVKIELTNPQGETVILNSDSFDDYTFGIISEAVEKYVVDQMIEAVDSGSKVLVNPYQIDLSGKGWG